MMRRPAAHAVALIAVLATASSAKAQQSDPALATQLFDAGRADMKAGHHALACPKLAESARLDARVGTLAKLAECEEHIGRLASSRAHWQQAMNLARTTGDERAADVARELSRMDAIVPKIVILVSRPPSDLAIDLDQVRLTLASAGVSLPVDPGRHTIAARAAGRASWTAVVETRADGKTTTVTVPELPVESAPVVPPKDGASTPPKVASTSALRTVGPLLVVAGAVSLVVGGVFGALALSDKNAGERAGCSGVTCPTPSAGALRDDARAEGTMSTIFVAAGGALTVGGLALWITAPRTPSASAGVSLTAGGAF